MRSSVARLVTGSSCLVLVGGLALGSPASAAPATPHTSRATSTTVAAVHATAAKKVTLVATVAPKTAHGAVAFRVAGTTITGCGKVTVRSGRATCSTTFTAGKHTVTAHYAGGPTYRASTGTRVFAVAMAGTTFLGGPGSCTTTSGVLVAVDFAHWGGPAVRGCGLNPGSGIGLLRAAGFTTAGTAHDGPQFLCRIGNPKFANGTQRPTKAQDPCVNTPPASAYWSFWSAAKGHNTWTYSKLGAYSDRPVAGEVEAWTFGATDIAGTKGQPAFTPNQARAGLPSSSGVRTHARAAALAGPASPNLDTGAGYLIDQLVDGNHYEPFGAGFADVGLTLDGGLGLAATGTHDASVEAITDYVAAHTSDYTFLGTKNASYADGGSIGKVALLAEVTGRNPRAFGGYNLIHEIDSRVCTAANEAKGCAGAGDYVNANSVFKQSLGLIAQLRAGDVVNAVPAATYLESLQRSSGGFPSIIPPTGPDDVETDSTGLAAMALALVPGAKARTALARGLSWLAGQQESNGGFPGAAGDSVNSAAIAVQALWLDAQTYASQIAKAESFLAAEQNADGGFNVAVGAEDHGSDVRASTQALGGAVGTPFGSVLDDVRAKTTATDGADYLVGQLTDGDHYSSSFDGQSFDDQGLTADGVFALLSAGGHADTVEAMTNYLKAQVDAYADPTGAAGGPYSGSLAKLALVAEATGGDPHSFAGTDLLSLLTSKVCTAAIAGDFSPCSAKGDFYNAFSPVSQALGVLALQASPVAADHLSIDSPVVVRLHQFQCADGGFSSTLIAPGAACTSEVDTTGYAIQALATVRGTDTWLGAAQAYLEKAQRDSGLFPGASGDNSNSTALAVQGLQSLVEALTTPTADPPQPKTITPIHAVQSALTALTRLSVAGGGFGKTSNATADLRSSAQAVAAAAQVPLLRLSGARVLSLPRVPAASAPGSGGSTSPSGVPSPTGSATSGPGSGHGPDGGTTANGGTADTGVTAGTQVAWALALLLLGAGLAWAGRRRVALVMGRHRVIGGRRHR